ncbi:MAG: hypothetical protein AAF437_08750 [Pseudomonadota bacterium]
MSKPRHDANTSDLMINQVEREAIDFAQSILSAKTTESTGPLSKIERQALEYARNLLKKFQI